MMLRRREKSQALVEFALTMPLFVLFVLVVIELSLVFVSYYSESRMARESARWLAVHTLSAQDSALAAHVQQTMLPGLVSGTPTQVTAGSLTQDAVWTVGKMRAQFTPCVPSGGSPPSCTDPNRAWGTTLYVQLTYDVSNLLFLPTQFNLGFLSVGLPTALPAYRVHVTAE